MVPPSEGRAQAGSASPDSLLRHVERYGTPLLLHDLATVRQRAGELRRLLPSGSGLLYSLKANPLPPVVAALQGSGCGTEVSSPAELAVAVPATGELPLLYTGPGKSGAEIAAAAAAGAVLSCESAVELARAVATGPRPLRLLLRVQAPGPPAAGLSMADGRQFGMLVAEAVELCRARPAGVELLGVHCYLGSQLPGWQALLAAFEQAVDAACRISEDGGLPLRILDLGGGFPWPYAMPGTGPDLAPLTAGLAELVAPLQRQGTETWFEAGRSLVAPAGRLLTTVMDVKRRAGGCLVVVDAGVNVLGGMSGLGRVLRPEAVFGNLTAPDGEPRQVTVVGPLCTPLDRMSVNTTVAEPRVGDLLCVQNVGGYASTAALSAFLSRPAAIELVTDGDRVLQAWTLNTGYRRLPAEAPAE
ncbi:MAG TPA: type III PLP-dependent enzyme [Jatrophihabitans sp.]|nr:type III PLP-dependent enzyme [Jatrophihabitans sp.]